jgi:Na+/proline symporter
MIYLLVYAAFMILFVALSERNKRQTTEHFLVADRKVGGLLGAMSIAASWIWAPAIFVSTKVGYEWGYAALVWFTIPNMLALMCFAPIARRVRKAIPEGFSYIQSLKKFDGGFRPCQLTIQLVMQVVIFALQITAGGELLSYVSGASFEAIVIIMCLTALAYSLIAGLHSSVLTDAFQYVVIVVAIAVIFVGLPLELSLLVNESARFNPLSADLLWKFGISSAVGLFFAIFADHQQWQRIFAIQKDKIVRTYIAGGLLHGLVTFSLGTLGILVFHSGFATSKPPLASAEFIAANMSQPFTVVFVFMALCGLCSTLDSALCAFGSLVSTELVSTDNKVKISRYSMLILTVFGAVLALTRLPIVTLWFLASTIRLASFTPTVQSVLDNKYSGRVGNLAIVVGLLSGGTIFLVGIVNEDSDLQTIGMLLSIGLSSLVSLVFSAIRKSSTNSESAVAT